MQEAINGKGFIVGSKSLLCDSATPMDLLRKTRGRVQGLKFISLIDATKPTFPKADGLILYARLLE